MKTYFNIEKKMKISLFTSNNEIFFNENNTKDEILLKNKNKLLNEFKNKLLIYFLYTIIIIGIDYFIFNNIYHFFNTFGDNISKNMFISFSVFSLLMLTNLYLFFLVISFFIPVLISFFYYLKHKNIIIFLDMITNKITTNITYAYYFLVKDKIFFVKLSKIQIYKLNVKLQQLKYDKNIFQKTNRIISLEELLIFFKHLNREIVNSNIECVTLLNNNKLCFIQKTLKEELPLIYKNLSIKENVVLNKISNEKIIIFEIDKNRLCDNILYFEEMNKLDKEKFHI